MSVSRNIDIRILTNVSSLSEFIEKLTTNFWHFKNESDTFFSIPLNDNGDFDYQTFDDINEVNDILDSRESKKELNAIGLWDKTYSESFGLLIQTLDNNYEDYKKHYLLSFSPDAAKRIEGSSRLTDYGYYLNQLIPKLISIDCYICEVTCHDYDC